MGEVFAGRYELADPIGRGGVGAVWRAWDHRRRRYVAAKVLQQSDAHALLRFVREQALRIDHPHVLAPASWAADDDKVLFTMDLVGGGSLVHLIGDYGPLPPVFVCTLLDQLLSGLAAVHAEGVVHRDIKPANILLEATGTARPRLRLSDFGIAMRLGEPRLTETNYVVGTPGYLAPEQLLGEEPDFPADLFAVGLVALYLLEGAKPDARALIEHFAAHGTPGAPKGVPEPLWQVVAALVQPDPQARFRTATGARKALGAARELLPDPGPDDEVIEIFDQLGPLPAGFGPEGPLPAGFEPDRPPPGSGPDDRLQTGSGPNAPLPPAPGRGHNSAPQHPNPGHDSSADHPSAGTAPPHPQTGAVSSPADAGAAPSDGTSTAVPPVGSPTSDAVPPPPAPDAVTPQPSPASTMSDTGSFHLPPPPQPRTATSYTQRHQQAHPQRAPQPQQPAQPQPEQAPTPPNSFALPAPAHAPSYGPAHVPSPQVAAPASQPYAFASTASYTARDVQVPPQPQPIARRRGRRALRRPGPPAQVAIPVLLLALVCFAVGFWALTQI
ncbi:serine/threonine-protein kinase [Streptomyces sp. NBC_00286]|uniref:serine/threonine-protein kinase n=1 Tax=Streptomyces sp. NBC_00286 TaxID=2975701 RepID=UPI002E2C4E0B|nr:protein kinase [Streptomyces sp. NBC_00286]